MGLERAPDPWQEAAGSIFPKAAVFFVDPMPSKYFDYLGLAFFSAGFPIILIRGDLRADPWKCVAVLIHECLHFSLEDPDELVKENGRGYWRRSKKKPRKVDESVIQMATGEKMRKVRECYMREVKFSRRPWDWGLENQARDILSCVW